MPQEKNQFNWTNGNKRKSAHLEAALTDYLIVGEAHDVHGLHCLLEILLVLLARDGNVTI